MNYNCFKNIELEDSFEREYMIIRSGPVYEEKLEYRVIDDQDIPFPLVSGKYGRVLVAIRLPRGETDVTQPEINEHIYSRVVNNTKETEFFVEGDVADTFFEKKKKAGFAIIRNFVAYTTIK